MPPLSYLCPLVVLMTAHSKRMTRSQNPKNTNWWLRAFFLLPAIEAAVSILLVFTAPSEGTNAWLLGLSAGRWLLIAGLFGIFSLFTVLAWLDLSQHRFWPKIEQKMLALIGHRYLYAIWLGVSLVVVVVAFYAIVLTFKFTDLFVLARLQRLSPIILWIFLFCLQTILVIPHVKAGAQSTKKKDSVIAIWKPTIIAFISMVVIAIFVHVTRLGLQPDRVGWDNPGVPLLGTQIFLALCLAALLYGLLWFIEKRFGWKISRTDWLAAFLLWMLAVWSWQSQPLTPTFFSPTPRAPNFEFYPYSDAATHDLGAQNLLIGNGFPDVLEKPLYSLFLAGLHALVGQDYQNVVFAQIAVLALFPVVLYLLGSTLHHRLSGGMLAFALILRETNAIALSGEIRVSHSKLLMTDLPTALGIAVFTLLLMRWLQSEREDLRWPMGVGGALGLLALLRSQTIVFLPVLLIVALWHSEPILRKRLVHGGIAFLGFALALSPWLFRNYQVTGQFGYSQPLQAMYLAKQYSLTPELAETGFPEGTPVSDYLSLGFSKVAQFAFNHPGDVAGFVSAHFFHNEVSSILVLPMRFDFADKLVAFYNLRPYWIGLEDRLWKECCSLDSYIANTPYWQNWNGAFPKDAWLPVFVNLGLISIGIGATWKKVGWLTMVPIGIHLLYNVSTAVARVSGWRLILPVDWILLMFYCLGIGQISLWAWRYIFANRITKDKKTAQQKRKLNQEIRPQRLMPLATTILFVGLLLPLAEIAIPARFESPRAESVQVAWDSSILSSGFDLRVADFLTQPKAEILVGRALYPRFYPVDAGEPGGQWSAFNSLPFSRMAFSLVGPKGYLVALPLESAPIAFPNASEVMIIGCEEQTYFKAAAIVFTDHSAQDLLTNNIDPFVCMQ